MTLQETVTVEFTVMLGASGQVTVNPLGDAIDDREIAPAKLLMLVRETVTDPAVPELMSVGATLTAKSPTCTTDLESCEEVPGVPFPVSVI